MLRPLTLISALALAAASLAQSVDPHLYQDLQWRCIGPFRGGRTVGATGVPGRPNEFYIGVNNGGVWKTDDAGRTWQPIFDDQDTGSIGDVAVAPSQPDTVYVGSGEGLQRPDLSVGDGIYKSTDAGKTWAHIGLDDAQQIGGLAVDPRDANKVFVAALGHPYGPNPTRGIFRTTDGGATWQKVLYKNETTGAFQVTLDPKNPDIVYADLWEGQQGPWENGYLNGPNNGLFKSTDGGTTWNQLTGLPKEVGRIGFGISPSNPEIIYATVDAGDKGGIYKTEDGGATWKMINNQDRLWGRGDDFAEIKVDPKDPNIVYDSNTCTYKSTDGGKTWDGWKGSPGGDDYHRIWINPDNPDLILLASDQGATLTENGGRTWSSWYNQPTAQLYHVAADNNFPYRLYSGQQESGSVGISSRGNDGAVTFREWHPVAAEEYGYCAPDPLNPNLIYGGKISRFDWRTAQAQNVSPPGDYRFLRTAPIVFSPADPHTLFYAGNVVFKTTNGGSSWDVISPDLTREHPDIPPSVGKYKDAEMEKMPRRGVVYALGPSKFDVKLLWAGTDDGLIQLTRDGGKTWSNVTPSTVPSWSKISQIDAGHFDKETAYIAVNRIRVDDMHPHILKTHDGGKSWTEIDNGLPAFGPVNVVREDPQQPGLLYAGTETSVWFSANDGSTWNPLRQNMPATSIRDLIVKDDDLAVGTHGRSFWILDDVTPLRQIAAMRGYAGGISLDVRNQLLPVPNPASEDHLFKPELATRVRWDMNTDTPLPPDEPAGKNPPDGAILNYYLASQPSSPAVLEIRDSKGAVVRHYSSNDRPLTVDPQTLEVPRYWVRPPQILSAAPGMHRFYWDLHYGPQQPPQYVPMQAIINNTAPEPKGPWALPGKYTIRLTVNGQSYEQPLVVRMDPRVTTSKEDLDLQFEIGKTCWDDASRAAALESQIGGVRNQVKAARAKATGSEATRLDALDAKLASLLGQSGGRRRSRFGGGLSGSFGGVYGSVEAADLRPTLTQQAAYKTLVKQLADMDSAWNEIKAKDLTGFTIPPPSPQPPAVQQQNGDDAEPS